MDISCSEWNVGVNLVIHQMRLAANPIEPVRQASEDGQKDENEDHELEHEENCGGLRKVMEHAIRSCACTRAR
jgi:hypothetical protein